jgi:hypothetical protein
MQNLTVWGIFSDSDKIFVPHRIVYSNFCVSLQTEKQSDLWNILFQHENTGLCHLIRW